MAATLNSGGNSGDFRTEPGEHLVAFGGNNTAGPIDIATAQNAHGGTGRLDFESETFIAFAQNTRDEVRLVNGDGAIAGALSAEPGMHQQTFVAHTLRGEGHDASEDGNGRGVPLVTAYNAYQGTVGDAHSPLTSEAKGRGETGVMVFESRYARNGRGAPDTLVPPLKAQSGQTGKGDGAPLVSIFQSSQSGVREVDAHPTLDSHNGSRRQNGIAGAAGVRRLTPVECERLQGFPDGWTGGQADSARYKQLGNAVAVPCAEWIGRRITLFAPEQPR